MKERLITADYLRENPTHVFVFGDNTQRVGRGGAAALRGEPNTYGFITKKTVSECYTPEEYQPVFVLELERLKQAIKDNPDRTYLISRLGAGLANEHQIWDKVIKEGLAVLGQFPNVEFLYEEEQLPSPPPEFGNPDHIRIHQTLTNDNPWITNPTN